SSRARMPISPVLCHEPGSAAGSAAEKSCLLVQQSGCCVSFCSRHPVHFIKGCVVEILGKDAVTQPPEYPWAVRLTEERTSEGIDSDDYELWKPRTEKASSAAYRAARANS